MSNADPELQAAFTEYRDELLAAGLLADMGVPGIYAKSGAFEAVVTAFEHFVTESGVDQKALVMRYPPILPRAVFEKSGYLKSFPHLAGTVHGFQGNERDHAKMLSQLESGADWTEAFTATDVVLIPAACYPVYPHASGTLPANGSTYDIQSYCFRKEPSLDPARMQVFRQREYVRLGSHEQVTAFHDLWLDRGQEMLRKVMLDAEAVVANDAFFGRAGNMLAASQRDQALKFELVAPICSAKARTAIVSCNYHQSHFGTSFGILLEDGSPAHTACIGFGLERITLALFRAHGTSVARWPAQVRATLAI